jgi:hypothetical protein
LGANLSNKQNIVFVFTKSDELVKVEKERKINNELVDYFNNGSLERFRFLDKNSFNRIRHNSDQIERWLKDNNCFGFINLANSHFRSVAYVMVSSLGDAPVDNKLTKGLSPLGPKCVLDPFLWALQAPNIKPPRKWGIF